MRKNLIFAIMILILCSCASREYRIHGTVTEDSLEGVQIFLVTYGYSDAAHVDSVYIRDRHFEFTGKEARIADLRVDYHHRDGIQKLLVATEPGDIFVTIGRISSGGGTPLNDSLEVWKGLTQEYNRMLYENTLSQAPKEKTDSIKQIYVARTHAMADAVGEDSILGKFLLKLYPR